MRLAAGLRPVPLGELQRFPRPLNRNGGVSTSKGEGKEEMGKGKERDGNWEREDGKGREGRGGEGRARHECVHIYKKNYHYTTAPPNQRLCPWTPLGAPLPVPPPFRRNRRHWS